MRKTRTNGNRVVVVGTAILVAGLLAGLTTSASAGDGGSNAAAAKKKKKKCPAGTVKQVVKKKGKKKKKCVPVATTPTTPAPIAKLSITPTSFDFGGVNQGGLDNCQPPPDADCPTQDFTVSNAGPNASGGPAASIAVISAPNTGIAGFEVFANTCTGPLAPGGTCTVTVRFGDDANGTYVSQLNVSASPGGVASATVMGS